MSAEGDHHDDDLGPGIAEVEDGLAEDGEARRPEQVARVAVPDAVQLEDGQIGHQGQGERAQGQGQSSQPSDRHGDQGADGPGHDGGHQVGQQAFK